MIGNPPWGGDIDRDLDYFHTQYPETTQEHTDSFKLFIERALQLARKSGLVSMIVPNTLLRQRRLKDVRSLMLQAQILTLVDLGDDVFSDVVAPSCVFVVKKKQSTNDQGVYVLDLGKLPNVAKAETLKDGCHAGKFIEQQTFHSNADLEFSHTLRKFNVPVVLLGDFGELECKDSGVNYQRVNVGMQEKGKSDLADRLLYEGKRQKSPRQDVLERIRY